MNQCPHQHTMRQDLPPGIPERMKHLPIDERGYPVPWFVHVKEDGIPEFRMMNFSKFVRAIREKLCWVCGHRLGVHQSFVLGPMCTITRTTQEPPSHLDCAQWSAKACPFLTNPNMKRREDDFTREAEQSIHQPGCPIKRNPGSIAVWTTREYRPFSDGSGGVLLRVGDPEHVTWWREGRAASRREALESIESGLPILYAADNNDPKAVAEINARFLAMQHLLP
jgi:hypothetical protein